MKTPNRTRDRTFAGKLRAYDVVSAAIDTHGGQAADVLNPDTGTAVEGEPALDYRPIFTDLGNRLETAKEEMLTANATHLGQLARVAELKARRSGVRDELFAAFTPARSTLEHLYGRDNGFTTTGVAGSTLPDPRGLVKQVRDAVDFFQDPKVELTPAVEEVRVDLPMLAVRLSLGADQLELAIGDHAGAEKTAEATRATKNTAIKTYDREFIYVARTTEGLFDLAGMHELAQRVRPSTRRPGRRAEDTGNETPDAASIEPAPADDTESASTDA
ncbi:MAG: hypothetical protein GY719_27300 [bacterium]|nr:hypothetical protein [bacterium]